MSKELLEAAKAVITQWDTPNWKLTEPTGKLINALRTAIDNSSDDEVEISLFLNDEGNLSIACNHPAKLYVSHELYDLVGVDGPEYGVLH